MAGCSRRTPGALTRLALLVLLPATLLAACGGAADGSAPVGVPSTGGAGVRSVHTDLAYAADSPAQKLDLYLPGTAESPDGSGAPSEAGAPHPVILYIHGGGFIFGDKAGDHLAPVLAGLDRAYAVASMDYRLSGEATFPAQINDVKAAIRWLRAHAVDYGLDPSRIAVWGGSAGGNLAALAGTSAEVAALSDQSQGNAGRSERVQAVIDWYGPISFLKTDDDFRAGGLGHAGSEGAGSYLSRYLGAALPTVPGKVKAADPITYISPDDPPFFIEHGTDDGTVPVQQSTRLAAALTEILGADRVTLEILPGAVHVDAAFFTPENTDLVLDWLDTQLK